MVFKISEFIKPAYVRKLKALAKAEGTVLNKFTAKNGNTVYSYTKASKDQFLYGFDANGKKIREVIQSANKHGSHYVTKDYRNNANISNATSITEYGVETKKTIMPLGALDFKESTTTIRDYTINTGKAILRKIVQQVKNNGNWTESVEKLTNESKTVTLTSSKGSKFVFTAKDLN